jgi:hypothetical protein
MTRTTYGAVGGDSLALPTSGLKHDWNSDSRRRRRRRHPAARDAAAVQRRRRSRYRVPARTRPRVTHPAKARACQRPNRTAGLSLVHVKGGRSRLDGIVPTRRYRSSCERREPLACPATRSGSARSERTRSAGARSTNWVPFRGESPLNGTQNAEGTPTRNCRIQQRGAMKPRISARLGSSRTSGPSPLPTYTSLGTRTAASSSIQLNPAIPMPERALADWRTWFAVDPSELRFAQAFQGPCIPKLREHPGSGTGTCRFVCPRRWCLAPRLE